MEKPSKDMGEEQQDKPATAQEASKPSKGPRLVTPGAEGTDAPATTDLAEATRIAEQRAETFRAANAALKAARTKADEAADPAQKAAAEERVRVLTQKANAAEEAAIAAARAKSALAEEIREAAEARARAKLEAQAAPDQVPIAGRARIRRRHVVLGASFLLWVVMPLVVAAWYLYAVADDQYASSVGFAVRTEEVGSAIELLGGITELSGSSSSDTDILYEFIQSQNMVRAVNERVDLRAAYLRPGDPVFGLDPEVRIEGLVKYWRRMVKVFYDRASGLIELRVLAFDPDSAEAIAQAIFDESSDMVNQLSAIARADTTRYAKEELDNAVERLKEARGAVTAYRIRTRIIDPVTDIQGRMGLVNSLQTQLAEALIELDLARRQSPDADPRVVQAQRKVEVIEERLAAERKRFSEAEGDENVPYSSLVSEYEGLAVDQEFAEKAYLSALAAYDTAQAEAQRKSRYLATYIDPTMAETAEFPKRGNILGILFAVMFLSWSIAVMIYYSIRDRR